MKTSSDNGVTAPVFQSQTQVIEEFRAAIQAAGLDYQGEIIPDAPLQRFKANGDKKKDSWYVLHTDGLAAGRFGCNKRQIDQTWCYKSASVLTDEERAERDRRWKQQQQERDADRQRQQNQAGIKAAEILAAAQPATDEHPYLIKKAVKAAPRLMAGSWLGREHCLLIPLRTASGQLATIQAISPDAPFTHSGQNKDFLKGGAKQGAYFVIGDLADSPVILIAEGYATAATLHEATGYAAVMACDTSGLTPVTQALKTLYPHPKIILICGDNDRTTEGNPGKKAAQAAAKKVRVRVTLPRFADDEAGSDFNDLATLHGLDVVKTAIESALNQKAEKESPATGTAPETEQQGENRPNPYRGTDDANADLLLELHGADIRFCPPWDKWLLWSGSHWRIDDRLDIDRLAADVPRMLRSLAINRTQQRQDILIQAADLMTQINAGGDQVQPLKKDYERLREREIAIGKEADWLIRLAAQLEGTGKRGAMLTATRHKVVIHHSDLDKGHFLLNASNGTVDLQTGVLRPHERVDLLTHHVEIPYLQNATAPAWLAFLHSTLSGDAELIQFAQRAIGYSLTGDVREQVLLICHGVGSNGKSVFLNILRKLLGALAIQAAPDLLMADKQRRHPTEQADLFGKRIIVCQETGEGRRFNETLVKQLTGGDGIRARRMHEDFWEFNPTHKLWLSTNHKPEIKGTDHAIWRRIRLIPFNVKFTDDGEPRKNPDMEAQLTAELPGILAWAVAGCLDWQRHGLQQPQAVKDATAGYQAEMDVLAAWISECCISGKKYEAKAADLYASYSRWCEQSGEHPENQRKWGMRLTERGFIRERRMVGFFWIGIGLLDRSDSMNHMNQHEPEKAIFQTSENLIVPHGKNAESGSYGSYGSCNTPPETPSPPVDANEEEF